MAAMILSRRTLSPALLHKLRNAAAAAPRPFTADALRDDHSLSVERGSDDRAVSRRRDDSFGGVFDPFFPSRSLSQVLNLMDQMLENPLVAASRGMGGGGRRDFDVREDSEGLYIRVDMPGLGKEDVKVTVEQDTLVIRGGGGEESEGEEEGRRYSSRIELPSKLYRTEEIKAEMKNGVLKILVPKVRAEERADVRRVSIE